MKRLIALLAIGGLAFAACSDDDDTPSTTDATETSDAPDSSEAPDSSDMSGEVSDEDAEAAADKLLAAAEEEGVDFDIDRDCVVDIAKQLSPADLEIVLAADDNDPELSPEGEALSEGLVACIEFTERTREALAEGIASELGDVDGEVSSCIADLFADLSDDDLVELLTSNEPPAEIQQGVMECVPTS